MPVLANILFVAHLVLDGKAREILYFVSFERAPQLEWIWIYMLAWPAWARFLQPHPLPERVTWHSCDPINSPTLWPSFIYKYHSERDGEMDQISAFRPSIEPRLRQ